MPFMYHRAINNIAHMFSFIHTERLDYASSDTMGARRTLSQPHKDATLETQSPLNPRHGLLSGRVFRPLMSRKRRNSANLVPLQLSHMFFRHHVLCLRVVRWTISLVWRTALECRIVRQRTIRGALCSACGVPKGIQISTWTVSTLASTQ